jgi:3-hydroxyacyl-[acyl-carrier-protein] dehydratase
MAGTDNPLGLLPHRPPFLFIDEVVHCDLQGSIRAVRTFRPEEDFFRGHFPGNPIVPGVLLLEGMAQTMAYLAMRWDGSPNVYLVGIDRARFRKPVRPGQRVEFSVVVEGKRLGVFSANAEARVDGAKIAEARLRGIAGPEAEGTVADDGGAAG